jgi:hypothetical protein
LDKVSRLDPASDILAEISRQAKNRLIDEHKEEEKEEEAKRKKKEEEAETDVLQDVAETMRRSGHLWMRIASKYAVEAVDTGSPKRSAANSSSSASSSAALYSPAAAVAAKKKADGGDGAALDVSKELDTQKLIEVRRINV